MTQRINPSILSADFANLEAELGRIASADLVHVDVMDNHFVPNLTIGHPVVARLQQVSPIPLDLHLMISDADRWAPQYAETRRVLGDVPRRGRVRPGRARPPHPPHRGARGHRGEARHPGRALPRPARRVRPGARDDGRTRLRRAVVHARDDAEAAALLAEARRAHGLDVWLQVDGGITVDTIGIAAEAGADTFVAGLGGLRGAMSRPTRSRAFVTPRPGTPTRTGNVDRVKTFDELFVELSDKARTRPEGSGTVRELDAGVHAIGKKIVEEAAEVWMAAEYQGDDETAEEISQLLYHLQVLMLAKGLDTRRRVPTSLIAPRPISPSHEGHECRTSPCSESPCPTRARSPRPPRRCSGRPGTPVAVTRKRPAHRRPAQRRRVLLPPPARHRHLRRLGCARRRHHGPRPAARLRVGCRRDRPARIRRLDLPLRGPGGPLRRSRRPRRRPRGDELPGPRRRRSSTATASRVEARQARRRGRVRRAARRRRRGRRRRLDRLDAPQAGPRDLRARHPRVRGGAHRLRRRQADGAATLAAPPAGRARRPAVRAARLRRAASSTLERATAAVAPGFESPTVSPLHDPEWVAVRVMIPRVDMNHVMDELYALGARAILVSAIHAARL